jgi:hypothetical protein
MANPIVPKNKAAPTGTARINGQSKAKLRKAMKRIGQRVIALYDTVPRVVTTPDDAGISTNSLKYFLRVQRYMGLGFTHVEATNAATYRYLIGIPGLQAMREDVGDIIDQELEDGDIITPFVTASFNLGTTTAIVNMTKQVPDYPITFQSMQFTQAHQVRVSIVQSRVFEDMQGLSGDMKSSLNRILGSGMAKGDGPRAIAKQIHEEVGIPEWNSGNNKASYARALRISRTEINHAHRTATRAQDQEANKLGIKTGMLWFSALSSTTRRTHARRHGHVHTREEDESFYSRDSNEINCLCSANSVVLQDGKPIDPEFITRLQGQGETFFKE